MVRIIKTIQAKHLETLSPWVKEFCEAACSVSVPLLPQHLATFPSRWPFPRGDLYHWISLLNRFDVILENFCKTYKLDDGPQMMDFACICLESKIGEHEAQTSIADQNLGHLGYEDDGDRQLVEAILRFSRMLLQNCGNRSIYASSSHLNSLLNSTSLPLLETTLLLGSELAQRYQAAVKRTTLPNRHNISALLANHYNIDLERVTQLSAPFTKTTPVPIESALPTTPAPQSAKGKEKTYFNVPVTSQKSPTPNIYANDLVSLVKGGAGVSGSPKSERNGTGNLSRIEAGWEDWGDVKVTYYPKVGTDTDSTNTTSTLRPANTPPASSVPTTPTPIRRSSNLGPHGQRTSRLSSSDDSPISSPRPSASTNDDQRPSFKVIDISLSEIKANGIHHFLRENTPGLPKDLQYELLTKLRAADALTSSLDARRQLLAVRLLAITNLAYVHSEPTFHENVLKRDGEEPRRLQLVYQLAELVHPPPEGEVAVPKAFQTIALSTLDALSQHQARFPDVCTALNTNVSHGVLLYVVRKAVAEMSGEDNGVKITEDDRWRDALFSLLTSISGMHRTGMDLVTAGLAPVLVEVLDLRTNIAERYCQKVLNFLDTIGYSAREAMQTIVSGEVLDTVSNLIVHEINSAADNAASGNGMPLEYRSPSVDYDIPQVQQQTIKWLFKFIHHMMTQAPGFSGNFDRLLRNLIDSSQLLESLRRIITNARTFGSAVWTHAVSILNDFINNEPTSFAIIAEAGLSRGLLEAVTGKTIIMPSDSKKAKSSLDEAARERSETPPSPDVDADDDDDSDDEAAPESVEQVTHRHHMQSILENPREGPLARGILPTVETINIVPQAFGAICLNNAGMKMFQASCALDSFFEIFESPEHVKCMDTNKDLPANLGASFDELVRHHPPLKTAIMHAVLNMVARVSYLCKTKGQMSKNSAKLWTVDQSGKCVVADEQLKQQTIERSSKGKGKAAEDGPDVEMQDVEFSVSNIQSPSDTDSNTDMTPYIGAIAAFLTTIFGNSSVRADFASKGGIPYLLDLDDAPSLTYEFADPKYSSNLHSVIAQLAEQKPHLTVPSLLKRAQDAADVLAPFVEHNGSLPFFRPFVDKGTRQEADIEFLAKGTDLAKALVNVQSLVSTLNSWYRSMAYNQRTSVSFTQINISDYYIRLIHSLGPLLGASLREEFELNKTVPSHFKYAVRTKDTGASDLVTEVLENEPPSPLAEASEETRATEQDHGISAAIVANSSSTPDSKPKLLTKVEQDSPEFKNFQTLRYLLSKMSRIITPFFQMLGKNLFSKRLDDYQKWSHTGIADALAETILQQLRRYGEERSIESFTLWIGMVHVLRELFIEISRHNDRGPQTVTIVLQAFKDRGGFGTLNQILESFTSEIQSIGLPEKNSDAAIRFEVAVIGTKDILSLYSKIANGKYVIEATQSQTMSNRSERGERNKNASFNPSQFLVEIRMAVLPTVRRLWESDLVEKAPSETSEKLIEVIRTIANADSESGALKRSDKPMSPAKAFRKHFKLNTEHRQALHEQEAFDEEMATEALFRCNNNFNLASEYCREITDVGGRNKVPEGDVSFNLEDSTSRPLTSTSTGTATPDDHGMAIDLPTILDSVAQQMPPPPAPINEQADAQNFDQILNQFAANSSSSSTRASPSMTSQRPSSAAATEENQIKQTTIDDLNEERAAIRDNLIDKCLDVINAHGEVTFEISDLITTVVNKSGDPAAQRKIVGETLVIALMSFAGEEEVSTVGKKVAAYAHLLALMLRDKLFYAAAVGELKDNLATILAFIKLSPQHSVDEPSPWIAQILLIVEMLLSEDARPRKTKWAVPKDENDAIDEPVLEEIDYAVPQEERTQILEAILDILPRIGKEESLALAVLRILVILTRNRSVAQTMGERKNIQRVFVMAKQLAGAGSARIQSPLMIILRHIIEDEETVKQIMRSDIKSFFDSARQQRAIDPALYLRGLSATAIRSPELFVEVTNEMVKYNRWTYQNSEGSSRSNVLALKDLKPADDTVQPAVRGTKDLSIQDVKASTEGLDSEMPDTSKTAPEHKLPVVEHPDGVIHFLLSELVNYKDVEDREPTSSPPNVEKPDASTNGDVAMSGTYSAAETATSKDSKSSKTPNKQDFKAEEHPIYIYRCFILQCLTELLSSYNRTKIEFINFKRGAPQPTMTPSKPRSGVINYLLSDLIPLGSLDHAESISLRKKTATSSWADSVLTALLSKTGEQLLEKDREPSDGEDEPSLLLLRRFVLENILRAYKDASTSTESLDIKYARMLSLADLMSHIMNGKENLAAIDTSVADRSQKQLKRIMFEKGFIAALTASIADIDLNFPGAKRAVKYILRPLKVLTMTAVHLSDLSLISATPGQAEEDEIESATSVSEVEDEREETPDLFRNSTLGMFEPGREEDSSSDSEDDDEEMYEGEYDEEMDYEEEMAEDDEDNISDEDEDIEGIGPIEGLSGDVEVIMEEEDDDEEDGSSDEDDDEHDSEDDDARVEIIDEAGNIQELGADDDMEEWESEDGHDQDDDDEEDYEAQAADQEEAELHGMDAMGMDEMVGGPLGHLVRALGGGEDAEEMLERMEEQMEAEGIDPADDDERMGAEYLEAEIDEDEDGDDDEDDMEEDEMFLDPGYPGPDPGRAWGWEGEVDPPMIIHRGHHHHRPRGFPSPFPLFPGGSRDPLGGMSDSPPRLAPARSSVRNPVGTARSFGTLEGLFDLVDHAGFGSERRVAAGGSVSLEMPNLHSINSWFRTNPNAATDFRYRSHRPGNQSRSPDDGTNPLLQRNSSRGASRDGPHRNQTMGGWIQAMGGPPGADISDIIGGFGGGRPFGEGPGTAAFFEELMRSLPQAGTIARNGAALQFHITAGSGNEIPRDLQAMFGMTRRFGDRRENGEPGSSAFFVPQATQQRWMEEAKLLFGPNYHEKANDLKEAIQSVLVPPAIEADKAHKAAELERLKKIREESEKQAEEERLAKEAREAEEKVEREKKEAEEREASERAAAEALTAQDNESEVRTDETTGIDEAGAEAMDGVETEATEPPAGEEQAQGEPAENRPRITTIIRGNPMDITDLGIDAEFLAELPEEIREEVIMSTVAERRSRTAATGAQPSEIDQEFLAALPEDIRDEIIQQERQDRRRRERDEQRRQAAANGDLAQIGRAGQRDHPLHARIPGGLARRGPPLVEGREDAAQRPPRRAIVQMLDKSGIATLLRLMFVAQQGSLRSTLNSVLENISLNRQNRTEVLNTLLSILQDGSVDMSAVERSFAHLTLRAKQPKDKDPKTPQPLKRTLTGTSNLSQHPKSDISPIKVVDQCLAALVFLTGINPHVPAFFLTEHEISTGLKRVTSHKGKAKSNKASKYALNSLLSLLDRNLIMESSSVMESLSMLLNLVTQPLQALQRKQKEAEDAAKKVVRAATNTDAPVSDAADSVTSPETTTAANEAPSETQPEPIQIGALTPVEQNQSAALVVEGGEASTSEAKPETTAKEPDKKQRPITFPVVPEHNLQLVINIFVARDCSSRTFRETLSTIKNLSTIPGAKAVFGRELITKAQELGEVILGDLEELLPSIQKATTGTEIQGVALAKFSPSGSEQGKLLRVLTALDHLFDPKRDKKDKPTEVDVEGESSQIVEKQDLLSTLYDSSTFGPMWEKLSACLSAIRQREHLLNVATILLPLIESLMVVCKNTTLKDAPIARSQLGKEMMLTSPPPESRMESLFFTFTEEHRKILNELVRHTPKLMSGTFSLLVKNPKVLEFDNKRNYFSRSIHTKNSATRQSFPPLQLSVRRDQVFHDSFKSLYFQTGDQMKYGKLSIRFHGEEGVDAGGVTREWFQVLSRQMFDPGYALFIPVSSDRTTFHPNQLSSVNEEHLMFFKFIGRIIGKALYENRVLDCHFSRAVYKRILGKAVSVKDMESLDPDYYKSLVWMLENDITDIITETFSVDNDKFGVVETIDFIPNGRNIPVTDENKHEYVRLMVEWKLTGSVKEQLDEFLKGFHDIIPADLVQIFNEQELELLISGLPEVDVDDWKVNTEYHNYSASSPQIQWFWRAVRSFDKEERAKLLQFVTGTSKVPLNGFKELEGMNGFSRFNIHRDYGNKERLPSSHTCFNQLDLPEYESYEGLRQHVLTAITAGSEYFGFA
ncbi:HECT-type E3 ubiquitin transferase [Hyphodiscus hymeniophilus]|uniref:HECT-type E3 ubiquitin transferase n=1 Tax=Hyphodiscus hymeniophilus TaxID=353542 RepID=A0A9P6VE93_9HELO|nr:HECT-type E3 ubiquitin transferase [Hyphodiscus hymeniophilus]